MPVNGSTVALGAKANITQQIAFAFGTIAGTQLCIRADINYSTPFLNTTNGRASFLTSTACYSYIAPLDSTQTQLFGPVPFPAVIAGAAGVAVLTIVVAALVVKRRREKQRLDAELAARVVEAQRIRAQRPSKKSIGSATYEILQNVSNYIYTIAQLPSNSEYEATQRGHEVSGSCWECN